MPFNYFKWNIYFGMKKKTDRSRLFHLFSVVSFESCYQCSLNWSVSKEHASLQFQKGKGKKHANDKQNILKLAISKLSFGIIQAIFHIKSEMVILFPSQSLFRWLNIYNMSFIVDCFFLSLSLATPMSWKSQSTVKWNERSVEYFCVCFGARTPKRAPKSVIS